MKNKSPMRRCIGCMESKPQQELLRLVSYDGSVQFDPEKKFSGRGAYLCKNSGCFDAAVKRKSFARTFKHQVKEENLNRLKGELDEKLQV